MNDTDPIHILIACDKNYAPYYGVMLTSLFANNSDSCFNIHWITDQYVPQKQKDKFFKLVKKNHSQLFIYEIDNSQLTDFPQTGHINYAAYYNLNAAKILPDTIHKIIYLDGDMIVNGDIRPLWELDLKGNVCAQVLSCIYYEETQYERLEYDKSFGIYNNGVTLYDMDSLRKMNFTQRVMSFINENKDKCVWMDQDAMNALLHDKTLRLPFKYNMQTLALTKERWRHQTEDFKRQILEAAAHPVVVHYNGNYKPWDFRYYGFPYDKLWNKYYKMSFWREAKQRKPILKYFKNIVKRSLKKSFFEKRCNKMYININW